MTPEAKNGSTPEQAALEKTQKLAAALKKSGPIKIETSEAKIYIRKKSDNPMLVSLFLMEKVPVYNDVHHTHYSTYSGTLEYWFDPNDVSSSVISMEVRKKEGEFKYFTHAYYRGERKTKECTHSTSSIMDREIPTPEGLRVLQSLPALDQMPEKIDFAAAVGTICDIALEIIGDRQLTPERIAKLKEVVYGQAVREPAGQK